MVCDLNYLIDKANEATSKAPFLGEVAVQAEVRLIYENIAFPSQ